MSGIWDQGGGGGRVGPMSGMWAGDTNVPMHHR